ncbi:MBL fold metallo-hydrolase [Streptomyces sp. NPDC054950]
MTTETEPDTGTGTSTLSLRRLGWAGVEIQLGDTRLLIDALENVAPLEPVLGPPKRPLPPIEAPAGTHALITHLHPDHYDRELLTRLAASGTIGCHASIAPDLAKDGIEAVAQELGQARRIGPLTVTPVTSLDWRGSDSYQVAWVVEGAGTRVIHCGDTMWHGNWWQIAREHGPFDVAFLPVNGVIARFEGYDATVPVTLTPEQAVEAAAVLGATAACAIHYELFNNPPTYTEQSDIPQRFSAAARLRGITAHLVTDGAAIPLPAPRGVVDDTGDSQGSA